jgi:hypothetical protein
MISNLSDVEVRQFLESAKSIGFQTELAPREVNNHPQGVLTAEQESQLKAVLSDFPEYIVPIFWSERSFVGEVASSRTSTSEGMLRSGYQIISTAGTQVGEELPKANRSVAKEVLQNSLKREKTKNAFGAFSAVGKFIDKAEQSFGLKPDPYLENYMGWAYVDGTIRGTALQDGSVPGPRRQGWLAVCRNSISIIGFWTPITPQDAWFQWNSGFPNISAFDVRKIQIVYAQTLPKDVDSCELYTVASWNFDQIEKVALTELIRYDGLGALLYSLHPLYWQIPNLDSLSLSMNDDVRCFPALLKELNEMGAMNEFENALEGAFQRIEYGACVAGGTGRDSEFKALRNLFNSAAGISVQSAIDGKYIFLESNFSELDVAFDLIQNEISSKGKATASAQTGSDRDGSLSSDLERLAELFKSGILTDDEFSRAKSAAIQKWSS